jgi:hypothetical protein
LSINQARDITTKNPVKSPNNAGSQLSNRK